MFADSPAEQKLSLPVYPGPGPGEGVRWGMPRCPKPRGVREAEQGLGDRHGPDRVLLPPPARGESPHGLTML